MPGGIILIAYDLDGVPVELVGIRGWHDAILGGRLTRTTEVTVHRRSLEPYRSPAGKVPELRRLFDALEPGTPDPAPEGVPVEDPPPAEEAAEPDDEWHYPDDFDDPVRKTDVQTEDRGRSQIERGLNVGVGAVILLLLIAGLTAFLASGSKPDLPAIGDPPKLYRIIAPAYLHRTADIGSKPVETLRNDLLVKGTLEEKAGTSWLRISGGRRAGLLVLEKKAVLADADGNKLADLD